MKKYYIIILVVLFFSGGWGIFKNLFTKETPDIISLYKNMILDGQIKILNDGLKSSRPFHIGNRERYKKALELLSDDKIECQPFLISAYLFNQGRGDILYIGVVDEDMDISDLVIREYRTPNEIYEETYPYFDAVRDLNNSISADGVLGNKAFHIMVPITLRENDSQIQNKIAWKEVFQKELLLEKTKSLLDTRKLLPSIYMSNPNKYDIEIHLVDKQKNQSNVVKVYYRDEKNK